jgi:GDPmannose 4,6-dehydratase
MTLSKTAKVALGTSITGKDGACLAEFFPNKAYEAHSIRRRASLFNTDRIHNL